MHWPATFKACTRIRTVTDANGETFGNLNDRLILDLDHKRAASAALFYGICRYTTELKPERTCLNAGHVEATLFVQE